MDEKIRIIILPFNRVQEVEPGTSLLDAIREAGVPIESICGGKGQCGKCRIIAPSPGMGTLLPGERKFLSEREIAAGYRLACLTRAEGEMEITVPVESRIDSPKILITVEGSVDRPDPAVTAHPIDMTSCDEIFTDVRSVRFSGYLGPRPRMNDGVFRTACTLGEGALAAISLTGGYPEVISVAPAASLSPLLGLALDMGTTTVAGLLVDLATGRILARASGLNTQITHGEELITRIAFSQRDGGTAILQRAAVESANLVIGSLAAAAGLPAAGILDVAIGGNTVMSHLLAGIDPSGLEMVDAVVPREPIRARAAEIGLSVHPNAWCYFLPNVSRFVGGDAVGDVLASGMHRGPDIGLLIDLGTNGEMVIGNCEFFASVSCASGPAFEGAGVRAGMRAMRGAIDHVAIDPVTGAATWTVIGSTTPGGICGSGIIDAAAGMCAAGIIDPSGRVQEGKPYVQTGPDGPEYVLVPGDASATGREIAITQADMTYLMDSKA
ncbi:MAG: ASKHA domain-containing protein, partial [Methanomicrobiales archaeon]|nr:ASKHA domain-containing protein [Methanomicrobiales archaeon]